MNRRVFIWGGAIGAGVLAGVGLRALAPTPRTTEGWPPRLVALIQKVEQGKYARRGLFPHLVEEYQQLSEEEARLHSYCASTALHIHHGILGLSPSTSDQEHALIRQYASLPRDYVAYHWLAAFVALKGGFVEAAPYFENPRAQWGFLFA